MPKYTFQFDFDRYDKVYDALTNMYGEVIGMIHYNGDIPDVREALNVNTTFFHDVLYIVKFEDGTTDRRWTSELVAC